MKNKMKLGVCAMIIYKNFVKNNILCITIFDLQKLIKRVGQSK